MTDTVTTRIRLPGEIHRQVKAQAAYHGINLDTALGMCVTFLADLCTPLSWLKDEQGCLSIIISQAEQRPRPF